MTTIICKHEGCKKEATVRGYCHYHYNLAVRNNIIEKKHKCREKGCNGNSYINGLCYIHYTRMKRDSDRPSIPYSDDEIQIIKDNYGQKDTKELMKMLSGRTVQGIRSKAKKLGLSCYDKKQDVHDSFAGRVLKHFPDIVDEIDDIEQVLSDNGEVIETDIMHLIFFLLKDHERLMVLERESEQISLKDIGVRFHRQAASVYGTIKRSMIKLRPYIKMVLEGHGFEAVEKARIKLSKETTSYYCKHDDCTKPPYLKGLCLRHYCETYKITLPFDKSEIDTAMTIQQLAVKISTSEKCVRNAIGRIPYYKLKNRVLFLESDLKKIKNKMNGESNGIIQEA